MPHEFSIIIPVHNEEACIPDVLGELAQVFSGRSYEVIVVDDGSTDETLTCLIDQKDTHPHLRVLSLAKHAGKSQALRTGILASRGSVVGLMDGDGQDDPAELLKLYRVFVAKDTPENTGLVMGERKNRREPALRRAFSGIGNRLRRWRLRDGARDSACGMKVMARQDYLNLPYFDSMHRFMPALVQSTGRRVTFVEIVQRRRLGGQSKYSSLGRFQLGISDLNGVAWLVRRQKQISQGSEY